MVTQDLKALIDGLMQSLDVSKEVLAGAMTVDARAIDRWRSGESFPQKDSRRRLDQLSQVKEHLYQTFNSAQAVHAWMHSDSPYLGGLKPAEVLRAGRIDRIEAALSALDGGAFV